MHIRAGGHSASGRSARRHAPLEGLLMRFLFTRMSSSNGPSCGGMEERRGGGMEERTGDVRKMEEVRYRVMRFYDS